MEDSSKQWTQTEPSVPAPVRQNLGKMKSMGVVRKRVSWYQQYKVTMT